MELPEKIRDEDLEQFGFETIRSYEAKHKDYETWRYWCPSCGIWVSDTMNGLCLKCLCEKP